MKVKIDLIACKNPELSDATELMVNERAEYLKSLFEIEFYRRQKTCDCKIDYHFELLADFNQSKRLKKINSCDHLNDHLGEVYMRIGDHMTFKNIQYKLS